MMPNRSFRVRFAKRSRTMRDVLLLMCISFVGVRAFAAPHPRAEVISGRVVAYTGALVCLNGNAYWSMVIHTEPRKNTSSRFVLVQFSLQCGKPAESVLSNPSIQKFHLIRQSSCDEVLKEHIDFHSQEQADGKPVQNIGLPIWKFIPGNERFTLPFGEVLPCYYSVELPLVPVL